MFPEQVRRLRLSLQALFASGQPLDETTFQWLVLSLIALEHAALDHAGITPSPPRPAPTGNIIPFPLRNKPRVSP